MKDFYVDRSLTQFAICQSSKAKARIVELFSLRGLIPLNSSDYAIPTQRYSDSTSEATNYTFATSNKRAAKAAMQDCLLEQIGAVIESKRLKTKDLQVFDPTLTAKQVSGIRHGDRSAASVERLERLARGLGVQIGTYDPCAVAA